MDVESQNISQDLPQFTVHGPRNSGLVVNHSETAVCTVCRRDFSPNNELTGDLEAVCGDCKFLLLEDHGTLAQESHQRLSRGRRNRYSSSESIENLFSQQFSQMINMVRQNQSMVFGREDQSVDGDAAARLLQHTSSHTTPSGSQRWRRVLSDSESDGFDNLDSLFGESESNISFGGYRGFPGDSDVISFSTYGGDSDASLDGRSVLDTEIFIHPDEGSYLDSDTDIDPMHAGSTQWNLDDQEEEEGEEEDGEWEEADDEENTVEPRGTGARLLNSLMLSPGESNGHVNWHRQLRSREFDGIIHWRTREGGHTHTSNIFANSEGSGLSRYVGNSGDYLDVRGFEELLEHLAETDSLRRGAPPAAVSFVNSMPRVVIKEEHVKHDGLACAICKDLLSVGSEVNQLPCFHVYHPYCILPWLSARNSCPLCRYEVPTDDKDYEEGKRSSSSQTEIHEIRPQGVSEDSYSDITDGAEVDDTPEFSHGRTQLGEPVDVDPAESSRDGRRGRWFFLAAAPIVSLVGIVLVLWLGNPLIGGRQPLEGRQPRGRFTFCEQGENQSHSSGSPTNQRGNPSRRWWSLF